jgi:hypothetical protein
VSLKNFLKFKQGSYIKAPLSGHIDLNRESDIVTGGARGIKKAINIVLAQEGANTVVEDIL